MKSISKILSANDIGATGGHQAGILIPKDPRILGFFPTWMRVTVIRGAILSSATTGPANGNLLSSITIMPYFRAPGMNTDLPA